MAKEDLPRTNLPPPPPERPRKIESTRVVSKSVAIALGIVCLILAGSILGALAYYGSQISSLNSSISVLQDAVSTRDSQISSLNSQVSSLNSGLGNLTDIVNLSKSTIWVNDQTVSQVANSYTSWTDSASYAGYVVVNVQSSTSPNTYVRLIYSSRGVEYDHQITVGMGGTAVFPVLPGSIQVVVGNTNLVNGATETVTITYYY
jgi:hypothetical protein